MASMIKAFRKLHDFQKGFDASTKKLEELIGKPICLPGCGKCCQTVTCMTIEAMNSVSVLLGDPRYSKIIAVAEGWLLEHHKEAPTYEGMLQGCFVPAGVREEFKALSYLPCPFLQENRVCMLYDARPLVCQAYGTTRAGNGFCPRPPGKGETMTQFMYIKSEDFREDMRQFKAKYLKERPDWVTYGFFPTLLYRAAKEKEFRLMIENNRIATAKIIGTNLDTTLMWQAQAEALEAGKSPDVVAAMG